MLKSFQDLSIIKLRGISECTCTSSSELHDVSIISAEEAARGAEVCGVVKISLMLKKEYQNSASTLPRCHYCIFPQLDSAMRRYAGSQMQAHRWSLDGVQCHAPRKSQQMLCWAFAYTECVSDLRVSALTQIFSPHSSGTTGELPVPSHARKFYILSLKIFKNLCASCSV